MSSYVLNTQVHIDPTMDQCLVFAWNATFEELNLSISGFNAGLMLIECRRQGDNIKQ